MHWWTQFKFDQNFFHNNTNSNCALNGILCGISTWIQNDKLRVVRMCTVWHLIRLSFQYNYKMRLYTIVGVQNVCILLILATLWSWHHLGRITDIFAYPRNVLNKRSVIINLCSFDWHLAWGTAKVLSHYIFMAHIKFKCLWLDDLTGQPKSCWIQTTQVWMCAGRGGMVSLVTGNWRRKSINSIWISLFIWNWFRFVREKSVSFRGSSRRDHSLNDYSHASADMEMSDPSARITMCRLLNGHQSMRQSCLENRT